MAEPVQANANSARPGGRILRFLIGAVILASVIPVYTRITAEVIGIAVGLVFALTAGFALLHLAIYKYGAWMNRWVGAAVVWALLAAVYILGKPGGILLGTGVAQLAATTFLGCSLILAGLRADSGCEVMAIPNALLGRRAMLVCFFFSPIDWLERKLHERYAR